MLFKKRKLDQFESSFNSNFQSMINNANLNNVGSGFSNFDQVTPNPENNSISNFKTNYKLKTTFDKYLDFVHNSYFSLNDNPANGGNFPLTNYQNEKNSIKSEENGDDNQKQSNNNSFKFSSLDVLMNPLRSKFIFEAWSPYEIALFECCICKYGKNFHKYCSVIRTKSYSDIMNFYNYWKQSKYYKVWKSFRGKKYPYKSFKS